MSDPTSPDILSLSPTEESAPSSVVPTKLLFDSKKTYEENLNTLKVFLDFKDAEMTKILFQYLPNITDEEVISDETRNRFNAAVLKNLDKILADEDKQASEGQANAILSQ